ncbi:sigma-70 family RNA polymerase sigma factor [Rhodocytophaga rosea]|uniref:Sigma-70 family RNA polymerase sigma factor n=1 Tax=Rhodocytophaga rosea TaxID=2704465 RepID=A0A6C0GNN3_9BACT|nr:sigma-70 family RNA polymerase sigma factor [Rhodocytophaga rosea]QHT69233.1 sigma-70 family RNA polymerase sigma factor [Rhodocytophaga rosea]
MTPDSGYIIDEKYTDVLFPYAYNILGAVEDARDTVQEVLTKHLSATKEHITDEKNYLIRSVINFAINLKTRRKKTRRKDDIWLPEPVASDDTADKNLHLNEILSYSLLALMERLNARERAVFILRESFDYSHLEIAGILSITEEHLRKLLSRAKASIQKPLPRHNRPPDAHERDVLERFLGAIRRRDIQQLESIMAADIQFYADGGGKIPLAAKECAGASQVAALQMVIYQKYLLSARLEYITVNHQPALLSYVRDRLTSCQVFNLHPELGTLQQIHVVLDPDKLKLLSKQFKP